MGYTVNGQAAGSSVSASQISDSTATGRSVLTGDAAAGRAAPDITDAGAAGIPLAHGDALEVRGENEPLTTLRLRLTSTSGTTVSLEAAGW